ncbi:MAG: DUF6788 family protein [Candidatus Binatia bacterium]
MGIRGDRRRTRTLESQHEQYRALAAELATIDYVLQGSIAKRWMTCGKVACRCTDDPDARHGPYSAWTYKRGGKTVCVYLNADQATVCGQWIKNNRRLEHIIGRLRTISRRVAHLQGIPTK